MALPKSTYYDENYRQTAALIRARRPYLIKNIVTGVSLFALTMSIYVYTIRAISQDDFEDVRVPDAPTQQPRGGPGAIAKAIEESKK